MLMNESRRLAAGGSSATRKVPPQAGGRQMSEVAAKEFVVVAGEWELALLALWDGNAVVPAERALALE
jgi:hypothetical protein